MKRKKSQRSRGYAYIDTVIGLFVYSLVILCVYSFNVHMLGSVKDIREESEKIETVREKLQEVGEETDWGKYKIGEIEKNGTTVMEVKYKGKEDGLERVSIKVRTEGEEGVREYITERAKV